MPHELDGPDGLDRAVRIAPSRLRPWIDGFERRHGEVGSILEGDRVRLVAPDGAEAELVVPFPPLHTHLPLLDALVAHVSAERRLGALLVRKGGFAVGVFDGPRLVASKVGSAYVQGKTKAGGWSQQRYARRRDNQSRKAYAEAAGAAVRVLLPHLERLEGLATGGDKPAVSAVLADPRLAELGPLVLPQVHAVPDPRQRVLEAFPEQFLAVQIHLNALA